MRFLLLLCILTSLISCSGNLAKYGKVQPYKSGSSNNRAFSFKVEGDFVDNNSSSGQDKKHSLMNVDEVRLLNKILINDKLCLDQYNYPSYVITSKQQKIYDITFANLIEQNYNAKPVSPRTYFGRCV